MINTHPHPHRAYSNQTRYLAYTPPLSSYHAQRIALERALVLSRILGRTLLLPPLFLGEPNSFHSDGSEGESDDEDDPEDIAPSPSFGDKAETKIRDQIEERIARFNRCRLDLQNNLPRGCDHNPGYTQVSWDWVIDLDQFHVPWVDRNDFTDEYLTKPLDEGGLALNLDADQDHSGLHAMLRITLAHSSQLIITDSGYTPPARGRHVPTVRIDDLHEDDHRLLDFSTSLSSIGDSGPSVKLDLTLLRHTNIRREIRAAMIPSAPIVVDLASRISSLLSGDNLWDYAGLHAALDSAPNPTPPGSTDSDHVGRAAGAGAGAATGKHMREAWWSLGRKLGVADHALEEVERGVWDRSSSWRRAVNPGLRGDDKAYPGRPPRAVGHASSNLRQMSYSTPDGNPALHSLACPRLRHTKKSLMAFNTPLFIASPSQSQPEEQAQQVQHDPSFRLFYSTFPCIFTLHSPEIATIVAEALDGVVGPDGVELRGWVSEWVGEEVVAHGRVVVDSGVGGDGDGEGTGGGIWRGKVD